MIPEKYLEYLALERILQKVRYDDKINISTKAAMSDRKSVLEKEIIENYKEKE